MAALHAWPGNLTASQAEDAKSSMSDKIHKGSTTRWGAWDGKCRECGSAKEGDNFRSESRICKKCRSKKGRARAIARGDEYKEKHKLSERKRRRENKERVAFLAKKYREKNAEAVRARCREYHHKNRDALIVKQRESHQKNKEQRNAKKRAYWAKNTQWLSKKCQENRRAAEVAEPWRKTNRNIATAIRNSINDLVRKNKVTVRTWERLVGFTLKELKDHIEGQFTEGMSWDNWGKFGWHIEHILPLSSFKFESVEDEAFKKCWSLSNLRPLWWRDNLEKGARV